MMAFVADGGDAAATLRFYPTNAHWPRAQEWGWQRAARAKREMHACAKAKRDREADGARASSSTDAEGGEKMSGNSLEELARGATVPRRSTATPQRREQTERSAATSAEIMLAAANGDMYALQGLLTASSSSLLNSESCRTRAGMTPLMLSSARGDLEAVELLMQCGADPSIVSDTDGVLAVHLASVNGHERVVATLLESAPETLTWTTRQGGDTPLMSAARGGSVAAVASVLACIEKSASSRTLPYDTTRDDMGVVGAVNIAAASSCDSSGDVVNLLVHHLTTEAPSASMPCQSKETGTVRTVRALELELLPGAVLAARRGNVGALSSLLAAFPRMVNRNVNRQRETVVMQAVAADQQATLELMMTTGECNLLCRSVEGKTLLHVAASGGCNRAAASLVRGMESERGMRIRELLDAVDNRGETALMAAVRSNNAFIVRLLLASGAALVARADACTMRSASTLTTPLHVAAAFAYLNARTRTGDCSRSLHEQLEIIDALLENGADIDAVDSSGRVPRQIAIDEGNVAAAELLALHARKLYLDDV